MVTPKKIIIKDLELADKEIARLRKEHKKLKEELNFYYKAAKQFRKDKDVLMKENEELELLEQAINELMVQCDIKYFRFKDKEFYKQEYGLNLSSKNN